MISSLLSSEALLIPAIRGANTDKYFLRSRLIDLMIDSHLFLSLLLGVEVPAVTVVASGKLLLSLLFPGAVGASPLPGLSIVLMSVFPSLTFFLVAC